MFRLIFIIRSFEILITLLDTDEFGIGIHSYHGYEMDSEIGWTNISSYTFMFFFFNIKFKNVKIIDQPE